MSSIFPGHLRNADRPTIALSLPSAIPAARQYFSLLLGTFPRPATLPLVEARAAPARRTPSSRSKLGGPAAHRYERHDAHTRRPSQPRQRRAAHARLLQRLRRIL